MNTRITEVKNTLNRFNSRLEKTEAQIRNLEDKIAENT